MKKWIATACLASTGLLTSCGNVSGIESREARESNNRAELTTNLLSWECPKEIKLNLEVVEVKPLVRLRENVAYQASVDSLKSLKDNQSPVTLKFSNLKASSAVCSYEETSGTLKSTVQIKKRIVEQFGEDSPRFAEATYLSLRFFSTDGRADLRATMPVFTASEGAPTLLEDSNVRDTRTLMTSIPTEDKLVSIGTYKADLVGGAAR